MQRCRPLRCSMSWCLHTTKKRESSRAYAGCTGHLLERGCRTRFRITVADNASSDATFAIAHGVADELAGVRAVHLDEKGRGRALKGGLVRVGRACPGLHRCRPVHRPRGAVPARRTAWCPVTPISRSEAASPPAPGLSAVHAGTSSPAPTTGSCGTQSARTSPTRSAASRRSRGTRRRHCCRLFRDDGWFFDTELLLLAEKGGPAHRRGRGGLGR